MCVGFSVLLLCYTDSQISVDLLSSVCFIIMCRLLCFIIVFVGFCVLLLCYTDSQISVDLLSSLCV